MDPQQRILLHVAHEALENAGYVPDSTRSWQREGFGCFIGAATAEWADCMREQVGLYHSTGIHASLVAPQTSNTLHFRYSPGISERADISLHEMGRSIHRCRHGMFVLDGCNLSGVSCPAERRL